MVVLLRLASSKVRPTLSSFSLVLARISPNLPNSVLTAPSTCHTSLERCSMAMRAEAELEAVENAARFIGPVTSTRDSRCTASANPGRAIISAYKPSVGRNRIAKSVVCGGCTYLSRILRAWSRRNPAMPLRAASAAGASARSSASCRRCQSSRGNLQSIGSQQGASSLPPRPGRRIGVLDPLTAARTHGDVALVLLRREHLAQQRTELHLAPAAACLDVLQHALQVAHADGEVLHLTQATVHLLEALRHLLEGGTQALFQRRLELLVHRGAHFVELGGVLRAQKVETLLQRGSDRVEALLARLHELTDPLAECLELIGLRAERGRELRVRTLLQGPHGLREQLDLLGLCRGRCRELRLQRLLELDQALAERLHLVRLGRGPRAELLLEGVGELGEPLADLAAQQLRGIRLLVALDREVLAEIALEVDALRLEEIEAGGKVAQRIVDAGLASALRRLPDHDRDTQDRSERSQQQGAEKQRFVHVMPILARGWLTRCARQRPTALEPSPIRRRPDRPSPPARGASATPPPGSPSSARAPSGSACGCGWTSA